MSYSDLRAAIQSQEGFKRLAGLYGPKALALEAQKKRYLDLVKRHESQFNAQGRVLVLSAPGRSEIIGNHTDHNRGKVLAAAVNLDTLAVVSPRSDNKVQLYSAGYPAVVLDLNELTPFPQEKGSTASLVRGIAAKMKDEGERIGGFDAVVTSQVLSGSGLSSSAAFEVLICAILDALYNGFHIDATRRAQISQYAENVFFGKPCGLMDQMACSTGGLVAIDFENEEPQVDTVSFSFDEHGYAIVVVDTFASHDDLTDEYSAIRYEMQAAAQSLGEVQLRALGEDRFMQGLSKARLQAGDRALLRGLHFFAENKRVDQAIAALKSGDLEAFFAAENESGLSSWTLLQNISVSPKEQPMAVALAISRAVLDGEGACRVHGGGFAGTTLNFVPEGKLSLFVKTLERVLGEGACHVLDVRAEGAALVFGD